MPAPGWGAAAISLDLGPVSDDSRLRMARCRERSRSGHPAHGRTTPLSGTLPALDAMTFGKETEMKKLLGLAAVVALAGGIYVLSTAAWAQEAEKEEEVAAKTDEVKIDPALEADVRKLLTLMRIEDMTREAMKNGFDRAKQQMPQVPADAWDKAFAKIDWGELVTLSIPVYAKHLVHADVKEMIKFYESPLGKRFLDAQPKISKDLMPVTSGWGQKIGMQIMQEVMAAGQQ